MVGLFPNTSALCQAFTPTSPYYKPAPKPVEKPERRRLFPAWSTADAAKDKAVELSEAAQKEYEKASAKAQAKVGGIELYSAKYYAACTVGGILACVSRFEPHTVRAHH
jgi:solute carrier family 25 (mitochondrial phosphate transporter), member 3